MKIKYVAKRKDICTGSLSIINQNSNENVNYLLKIPSKQNLRLMIFRLDNSLKAEDLVFSSPENYSIYNTSKENNEYLQITNYSNLEDLLKYIGLPENLTQAHLNQIIRLCLSLNKFLNTDFYFKSGISLKDYYNLLEISKLPLEPQPTEPNYALLKKINHRLFKIL